MGVAILGTVLSAVYHSHLDVTKLPALTAAAARSSVAGGIAVAHHAASPKLLDAVRTAFVQALDVMLWVCGGIALAAAVLALAFLPARERTAPPAADDLRVAAQITD
jgi:hypothetical protein